MKKSKKPELNINVRGLDLRKMKTYSMHSCGRFPTFAVILLVLSVLWLLTDLGVITVSIPWIPVILIVIAIGGIISHYSGK